MHRNVIRLIASDLILRLILARVNDVALESDSRRDDLHNRAADTAGFGIPTHVISDFEALCAQ